MQNVSALRVNLKVTNKVLDVKYIKDIAPTSSLTNTNIDNPRN